MAGIGLVVASIDFNPIPFVIDRKRRISLYAGMYARQIQTLDASQSLGVQRCSPNDKNLGIGASRFQSAIERCDDAAAGRGVGRIVGQDQISPVGQWPADGFVISTAHQNMVPGGKPSKVLEVVREMPGEAIARADHAVFGDGGDN